LNTQVKNIKLPGSNNINLVRHIDMSGPAAGKFDIKILNCIKTILVDILAKPQMLLESHMRIKFNDLKNKMSEITGLLFTHPDMQDHSATEVWIKFRNDGVYAYINFEQPLPSRIILEKLVGAGNALNCSDYKKDKELIQYAEKSVVLDILNKSENYKGNMEDTVKQVGELFEGFPDNYLY